MSDRPKSTEQMLRKTVGKRGEGSEPPEVKRGDEIDVEGYHAIVYAILYDTDGEPDPNGYHIGVVFLENNRGMANRAQWSETNRSWKFVDGEIARDTRPALDEAVKRLRFRRVK